MFDFIMIRQITCYSWINFTSYMFDLAWSIHRKYRLNKMRHTLTPLSNHCKFQGVPHASVSREASCKRIIRIIIKLTAVWIGIFAIVSPAVYEKSECGNAEWRWGVKKHGEGLMPRKRKENPRCSERLFGRNRCHVCGIVSRINLDGPVLWQGMFR